MKIFNKTVCIVLCVLMTFSCVSVCASAEEFQPLPTVYLHGAAGSLSLEARNVNAKVIYPITIPDGYIGDACKELALPLGTALLTNNWAEYNAGLYAACKPIYKDFSCDRDGKAVGNSGSRWISSVNADYIYHEDTAAFASKGIPIWKFEYDWRLDPITTADLLHDYIQNVKSAKNVSRVNVIARCLGANIMLAYFDKYGASEINDCIFVCAGFEGFEAIEAIFTGKIKLDSASVNRFVNCYLATDSYADDTVFEMIRYLATCLDYIKVLDFSVDVLQQVVNGVKNNSLRRMILESVGTMPSFWSYIGDDCYEAAKAYVFGGVEEEYANIIDTIDAYHDIIVRWESILDSAEKDGARMYIICKYGFQMIPVTGIDNRMSDSIVTTPVSSLGATCSTLTGRLPLVYTLISKQKYVSADRQINASTCKYPDHTWFIKNIAHRSMPVCLDYLYAAIIDSEGYTTVFDIKNYPQFMVASDDNSTISPLTAQNGHTEKKMKVSAGSAFSGLVTDVIDYVT